MIFLFPIARVLVFVAIAYTMASLSVIYFSNPEGAGLTPFGIYKTATVLSVIAGLILFAAFSLGWRYVWRWFPKLNRLIFPDLNGDWEIEISWNRPGRSGVVQARARIKQDFLRLSMEVHSPGSDSQTLLAQPKKDPESGTPILYYIYRVVPKMVDGTKYVPYEGAATLRLSPMEQVQLDGNYFTSSNSAGNFRITRLNH